MKDCCIYVKYWIRVGPQKCWGERVQIREAFVGEKERRSESPMCIGCYPLVRREECVGFAKHGGPMRLRISLSRNFHLSSYCLPQISPRSCGGVRLLGAGGIDAVGRRSEGSAARRGGRWEFLAARRTLCVLVREDLWLVKCLNPLSPEKARSVSR